MLNYLPDLEADFAVFYRIDDIYQMDSVKFLQFAHRSPIYQGAMRFRMEREQEELQTARDERAMSMNELEQKGMSELFGM